MHEPPSGQPPRVPGRGDLPFERYLELQYEITRIVARHDDLDTAGPALLEALCDQLGWRTAGIWAADPATDGLLRCVAIYSGPGLEAWRDTTERMCVAPGEALPGRVWADRRPIWIDDLGADAAFPRRDVAERSGLRHGMAFPVLLRDGRVRAVVECFGAGIEPTDRRLVRFLEAVGTQFGAFLERVETRRALAASEARKAGVLEGAVDAIVSADAHGRILDFNPAAERLFGRLRGEVLGERIADILVPEDLREAHVAGLDRYLETGVPRIMGQRVRTSALRKDGTTVPVELTVTEVRLEGQAMFTAFIRDVTGQRQAEVARERFLEILSHELRTPVTAIYGGSKVLARPQLTDAAAATLVADMGAEADRLYRLVEDLIVLARAERGAHELTLEPVQLDRLVARIVEAERQRDSTVHLRIEASAGGSPPVLGEETYTEQVIRNLLSNAVKYAGTGRIEVRVEYGDGEGRVRVLDEGPGVLAEEAERLFEIDYRSPATEAVARGLGIGLFVSRWLAQAMGGRIWARPRSPIGSEFGFALRTIGMDEEIPPPGPILLEPDGAGRS